LLLLNNCTDASLEICNRFTAELPGMEVYEAHLQGAQASAGEARRLALQLACRREPQSILLTTDADAVPERAWIEKNIQEMAAGAQVVCGVAEIDPRDAKRIPQALQDDAGEIFLLSILDEITALLNPSIALRSDILQLAGGPPAVATCEDRVLIERLRLVDARIRHAPQIRVQVSGRLEGRAAGGMAETIKRRMLRQDDLTDEKLEPAIDALRRAMAQSRLRAVRHGQADETALARDMLIGPGEMNRILQAEFHGLAWARLQAVSPVLHRRRVAFADLPREIRIALGLRERLLPDLAPAQMHGLAALVPYA
jgi:hypothetical protein